MAPDVGPITKAFDYLVPERLVPEVRIGTIVRILLHGRRVRGWVVDLVETPDTERPLQPIAKVTGWGPSPDLIELARWAAWRWAGRLPALLGTASPAHAVRSLPEPPPRRSPHPSLTGEGEHETLATESFAAASGTGPVVVRLPPPADLLPFALEAAYRPDPLILSPSIAEAAYLAAQLRRAGQRVALLPNDWAQAAAGGCIAIGARAAAWAPRPALGAVVVFDEHDEGYQEERAPTWNARDVAIERARRQRVPCVLTSPVPSLEALACGPLFTPSRTSERSGWPPVEVVDRRQDPPGQGLWSSRLAGLLREIDSSERLVCVLNRKGRARLLACRTCGELSRCERCSASVEQVETGLICRRCGTLRPPVCLACGATTLKALRVGVSRAREELEALAGRPVMEITVDTSERPAPGVSLFIGTAAVLHRLASARVVAFLDFDQEVMAPRYRAAEQALAMLARAARLVGGRESGGRLVLQTRLPDHEVISAAVHADPGRLATAEGARRSMLRFPPASAVARVSGQAAEEFIGNLPSGSGGGVEVIGPAGDFWLLRASNHQVLCDALDATLRPSGRLRVEVDPLRI